MCQFAEIEIDLLNFETCDCFERHYMIYHESNTYKYQPYEVAKYSYHESTFRLNFNCFHFFLSILNSH